MKGYMFVEGHGETAAAGNLIARLWSNLALSYLPWHDPIRWNGINSERGLRKALQVARGWSELWLYATRLPAMHAAHVDAKLLERKEDLDVLPTRFAMSRLY